MQYVNIDRPELVEELLKQVGVLGQQYLDAGNWRQLKLVLRFLACLHGLFDDNGLFTILEDLFQRTIDLQTASSEDVSWRPCPMFRRC